MIKSYKGQIVAALSRKSMFWHGVHLLKLHQNMCLVTSWENHQFAHWLFKVGNGENSNQRRRLHSSTSTNNTWSKFIIIHLNNVH
jgi:hypothetical protein